MNPLISIIVPCYNQAQYLDECLQSVFDQTYENWECIIVNDGGTDNTDDVVKQWLANDVRFKYFVKVNGGVASARNFGIEKASGTWILPLDADDLINPKYLQLASEKFPENYDIIYCKAVLFGIVNKEFRLPAFNFDQILLDNQIFNAAFFQKEKWQKIGGYDVEFYYGMEDWEFWINLLKNSNKKVHQLDYLGFNYRRKDKSRDTEYNHSTQKKNKIKSLVFEKHKELYIKQYGNYIDVVTMVNKLQKENLSISTKHQLLLTQISKNIFTKGLFKMITIFSK